MKAQKQTSFKTLMVTNHSLVSDSAALSRICRSPFRTSYTIHLLAVSVCVCECFCETLVYIPAFHINFGTVVTIACFFV